MNTNGWKIGACCAIVGFSVACGGSPAARPSVSADASDASTTTSSNPDASTSHDAGSVTGDDGGASSTRPFVMFVVDSSSAMERRASCTCTTKDCTECLPDCSAGEKSAWIEQLEALTGTFTSGNCVARARTVANGATYDLGYSVAFHEPPTTAQKADGVLAAYASTVWLGIATFDGIGTLAGKSPLESEAALDRVMSEAAPGMWSFGGTSASNAVRLRPDGTYVGRIVFPTGSGTYGMDTGIRNADAVEGGLKASFSADIHEELANRLLHTRTFGSVPVAASLDDLDEYFRGDSTARGFHGKRYVVLVTGQNPDDDFRSYRCSCSAFNMAADYCGDGVDPEKQACPYPLPADAAKRLLCGYDATCHEGTVDKVFVVGFVDKTARAALDAVAKAGGTDHARAATTAQELRDQLRAVLGEINAAH